MNDIDVDHPWVIVHLSDVHIPSAGTLADRVLGPVDRFRQALNDIERFHPDHLLITGDLTDAGHPDEYDRLKAVLEHAPCPTTIIGGNHDEAEVLSERIAQAPALNGLGATVEGMPIRLVLIASAVPGRRDGELGPERLRWLDETLDAAPDTPTIVATHHPPLNTGTWWMDYRGPRGQEELEEVIGRHQQVIRVLAGHLHRPMDAPFAHTICSVAGPLVLSADPALSSSDRPTIADEPTLAHILRWDGRRLIGMRCALARPDLIADLTTLITPWDEYESAARAGDPMRE